ncbi:hypothetical protein C8F01DRAFT_1239163 [Mycena amicta]|nr:hypothetical protein C8F01DRAFT_1239163 [Mycena amicta]
MGRISIQDLPPEILATILSCLHPRDLVSCHLVSRFWTDLVQRSPDIQYSIELWRDGLLCGDPGTLTPAECLTRLHARRNAWRELKWSSKSVVSMQSLQDCRAYEFSGGILALQDDTATFDVLSLPRLAEVDDPNEARVTSTLHVPRMSFVDFTLDAGQDLLAVLYIRSENEDILALRRLSTPETPHPSAQVPEIYFGRSLANNTLLTMQILDDIVAIYHHSASRLLIFDWRKGVVVLMLAFDDDDEYYKLRVVDCNFLSPRLFLLACRNSGDAPLQHGWLQLCTLSDDLYPPVVTHIASLELPELAIPHPIHCRLVSMAIMAGPYTGCPTPGAQYYQSNDRRIVTFTMRYHPLADWVRLVVHIRTLLSLVDEYRSRNAEDVIARQWEEWGPQQTRMLLGMRHLWPRHVHGERIVLSTPSSRCIRLLDFNVLRLPATETQKADNAEDVDVSSIPSNLDSGSDLLPTNIISTADPRPPGFIPPPDRDTLIDVDILHTTPSELQMSMLVTAASDDSADSNQPEEPETILVGLFKHAVRTTLPYREIQRVIGPADPSHEPEEYDLFLLDEGHVIAANTAMLIHPDQNADYEVVVFRMS